MRTVIFLLLLLLFANPWSVAVAGGEKMLKVKNTESVLPVETVKKIRDNLILLRKNDIGAFAELIASCFFKKVIRNNKIKNILETYELYDQEPGQNQVIIDFVFTIVKLLHDNEEFLTLKILKEEGLIIEVHLE